MLVNVHEPITLLPLKPQSQPPLLLSIRHHTGPSNRSRFGNNSHSFLDLNVRLAPQGDTPLSSVGLNREKVFAERLRDESMTDLTVDDIRTFQHSCEMGNAGSGDSGGSGGRGCGSSSRTECAGGGGFAVAHDGHSFSLSADRDGHFSVSGGPYADASTRDAGTASSNRHVHNMCADRRASVTEHTHHAAIMAAAAASSLRGSTDAVEMLHGAGRFHTHTHDPVRVGSVIIAPSGK